MLKGAFSTTTRLLLFLGHRKAQKNTENYIAVRFRGLLWQNLVVVLGCVFANTGALQPNTGALQPNAGALQPNAATLQPNTGVLQPNAPVLQPNAPVLQPNAPVLPFNAAEIFWERGYSARMAAFSVMHGGIGGFSLGSMGAKPA